MHFLFLSEVPENEPPPGSPAGPLCRELPVYRAFFYISLKFLIKISRNKEIFFLSHKGLRKGVPLHVSQKWGPYGNIRPFPEP